MESQTIKNGIVEVLRLRNPRQEWVKRGYDPVILETVLTVLVEKQYWDWVKNVNSMS